MDPCGAPVLIYNVSDRTDPKCTYCFLSVRKILGGTSSWRSLPCSHIECGAEVHRKQFLDWHQYWSDCPWHNGGPCWLHPPLTGWSYRWTAVNPNGGFCPFSKTITPDIHMISWSPMPGPLRLARLSFMRTIINVLKQLVLQHQVTNFSMFHL